MTESGWDRRTDRGGKLFLSAALSFAGIIFLPLFLNLKGNTLAVSNSYISVFLFGACWYALYHSARHTAWNDKRGLALAAVFSFFFSLCIGFGVQLERDENVNFKDLSLGCGILVWTAILTVWVHRAWEILEGWNAGRGQAERAGKCRKQQRKKGAGVFCAVFFCWLPVFLAVYPGFFVYDAEVELTQVMTRSFTTHHPLPHELLLGGIVLLVHKLIGSYNAGIAAYTLLQMLLLAGVFTCAVGYMRKKEVPRYLCLGAVLYFALFPVIVMFALCSVKDSIFAAALLLLLFSMADLTREKHKFFCSWKKPLLFGICAVVMMSFRHNGMYAFLVMTPVLLLFMKGCRKKLAALLGAVFAVYFLLTAGLAAAVGAQKAGNQEMLTVPIQQLARTWKYEKDSFSEEDLAALYAILPEKALSLYAPKVSDGVKARFDNAAFQADPFKYISLWARTGIRHPFTYCNAWLMTSYGFWYPDTVIDVYRGNSVFTFTYGESSFFGYEVEAPGERHSKLPWLNEWYRRLSLEITQQKVPVLSQLFSPGFLFWVYLFIFGYTYHRRNYSMSIVFVQLFLVWLTVILGPTYLPRYVLILWFGLPSALAVLTGKTENDSRDGGGDSQAPAGSR